MNKIIDRTGEKAAEFELKNEAGLTRTLQDFSGNWLLMVFHRHHG